MAKKIKLNQKRTPAEKKSGEFYQMFTRITDDNRLTGNAHWVLCSILSNAPTFNILSKELEKRLGLGKDAIAAAFVVLEKCGYVRRTKLRRGFFYEVSEFGNLKAKNTDDTQTSSQPKESPAPQLEEGKVEVGEEKQEKAKKSIESQKTFNILLEPYLTKHIGFIKGETMEAIRGLKDKYSPEFYSFKSYADKVIKKAKTKYYNDCLTDIKLSRITKQGQKVILDWLKDEIFKNNNDDVDYKKKMNHLTMQYRVKPKFDAETELSDKLENPEWE